MKLLLESLRAAALLGLPAALVTFGLVWWALRKNVLAERQNANALTREIKGLSKKRDDEKKTPINPVHDKWLKFGGGFYGVVALYTYALIEFDEVVNFIGRLGDLVMRLDFGILVAFLVNSLTNFIGAITWPVYWIGASRTDHVWIWFAVAYAGYWAGLKAALKYAPVASPERHSAQADK